MPTLRIGAVAARSGVSRDTIRYYERLGLLGKAPRSDGGYRLYSDQALMRLRVIRNARRFGFSLTEIRGFMKVREAGGAPCAEVKAAAERRLREVEAEIRALDRLRRGMRDTLERWNDKIADAAPGAPAHLLEDELPLPDPPVAVASKRR